MAAKISKHMERNYVTVTLCRKLEALGGCNVIDMPELNRVQSLINMTEHFDLTLFTKVKFTQETITL